MRFLGPILVGYLVLSMGCASPVSSKKVSTAKIESVGWSITNTPQDWWSATSTTKPALSYDFTINLSGDYSAADLSRVRVYLPDDSTYWTLPLANYDPDQKSIHAAGFWFSTNSAELPIGRLRAEVALVGGAIANYSFTMGRPGSDSPGNMSYVFSADDLSSATHPGVSVEAVRRPIISTFSNSGSVVTVGFTVAGQSVNNGRVWLYNSAGQFIGYSELFRDKRTGASFSGLSGGNFHRGAGEFNSIALPISAILTSPGVGISQDQLAAVSHARVVVFDGAQYNLTFGDYSYYDYRAISKYY